MNVRVIANPISGGGRGETAAREVTDALQSNGETVDLVLTQKAGDAREAASRRGAECIVSVGGDGTANEIANGMKNSDAALAILPMGTANVVARALNLPKTPVALARLVSENHTRLIDVGVIQEEWFLLGAGAGLDAAITHVVSEQRGKRSSYLKWVSPVIRTAFTYRYPPIRVRVDGKEISDSAQYAIVGNCRYSAGAFPATPKALLDDGLLDVCLLHNLSVAKIATLAVGVWSPNFTKRKDVTYVQGKEITLEPASDEPVPLQVDGDPAGFIPVTISVHPKALRVVIPAD